MADSLAVPGAGIPLKQQPQDNALRVTVHFAVLTMNSHKEVIRKCRKTPPNYYQGVLCKRLFRAVVNQTIKAIIHRDSTIRGAN